MKKDYYLKNVRNYTQIWVVFAFLTMFFTLSLGLNAQVVTPTGYDGVCEGSSITIGIAPAKYAQNTFGLYLFDGSTYTKVGETYTTVSATFDPQSTVGEYQVWSFSGFPPAPADPTASGTYLDSKYVWANPVPGLSGEQAPCLNSNFKYSTESGMTSYVWTVTNGTVTAGGGSSDDYVDVSWDQSTGAGSVSVSYTDGNGCTANTATALSISVKALPVVTISGDDPVCTGYTETYTTESGMSGYTWSVTGGAGTSTTNSIDITWGASGSGTVSVNYTNGDGCTAASPTVENITINALPVPTISGETNPCANTAYTYTTEAGMSTYNWTIVNGTGTSTGNSIDVTWDNTTGPGSITVSYDDGNSCNGTSSPYNVNIYGKAQIVGGYIYCTIQDAIDNASTGQTVILLDNVTEDIVTLNKDITLDGDGYTLTSTSANYGIQVITSDVTIQNITITGAGTFGIHTNLADNFTLTNSIIDNNSGTGIALNCSNGTDILTVTSTNNGGNGLSITDCTNTTIDGYTSSGNLFTTFGAGIGIFADGNNSCPDICSNISISNTNITDVATIYEQNVNGNGTISGVTFPTSDFTHYVGFLPDSKFYYSDLNSALAAADYFISQDEVVYQPITYVKEVVGTNFYVAPKNTATENMSIQAAIDGAETGDVVNVLAGSFEENVSVNKEVSLLGAGLTQTTVIGSAGPVFYVTADNVSIEGFEIKHNTVTGEGDIGIRLELCDGATIQNNSIVSNSIGAMLWDAGSNQILSNSFDTNAVGLYLEGTTDGLGNTDGGSNGPFYSLSINNTVNDNTITNCFQLGGQGGQGIYLDAACESNTFNNNTITDNAAIGYYAWKASNNSITNNTISGNGDHGIQLMGSSTNTITGNTLDDNNNYGIWIRSGALSSTGNDISDNTITNTGTGLYLQDDVSTNNYVGFVSGNTIEENRIYSNTIGMELSDVPTGVMFVAENNYWGDASGPFHTSFNTCGIANPVVGNVDFMPWWTTPSGTPSGDLPVVNVTNDPDTYYCSIQDAINDASAGDVIEVAAGTYVLTTRLTINTPITLNGAGIGQTIITRGAAWTPTTGDLGIAHLVGIGADNVTLSNLTVTGAQKVGTANGSGINVYVATGVEFINVESKDNQAAGFIINGSTATMTGVVTSGNGWYAANVARGSGVTQMPSLTVDGTTSFGEAVEIVTDADIPEANVSYGYLYVFLGGEYAYNIKPFDLTGQTYATIVRSGVTYIYGTIAEAINAAIAGEAVNVSEGTHTENVVIDKGISLLGANADTPCGSRGTESIIAPASGLPVSITADGVTLNGFEITAPNNVYAINMSNTSNTNIEYNNIHDIGSTLASGYVHSVVYQVGNAVSPENVYITNNCFDNIGSSSLTGSSASAISVLQSLSTGVLTNIYIENNTINNVVVNTGTWPTGKIAYGVLLNTGSANYTTTDGKIVNAQIKGNTITNLTGFISTGIGLEGNTENAVIEGNTVADLTGYKLADRAGGGYDLQALKFESNRYVGTVTVQDNSFQAETFTFGSGATTNGYALANYVPMTDGGAAEISCNWLGSANYGEIVAEYTYFTGKVFNKEGAGTDFIDYLTTSTIGPGSSCNGVNASLVNLNVSYTPASQNVVVTFDMVDNSTVIYPIPDLDPNVPAELAEIVAKYAALEVALIAGDPDDIKAAALDVGDDIITEYYYYDGPTKVYLQTIGGNDLVKNKYWEGYLNNVSVPGSPVGYPDFTTPLFEVPTGPYSTSTNPLTGTVADAWLTDVLDNTLYVSVTTIHNGEVNTETVSVYIAPGPVENVTQGKTYVNIQDAIDEANTAGGDVIVASAGTYEEAIYIDKSLELRGANYGISGTGTRGAESIIQFPDGTAGWYPLVYNIADDVVIDGFTLSDEGGVVGDDFSGILSVESTNIQVLNNIVDGFNYISIWMHGAPNPALTPRTCTVTDNYCINNHGLYHTIYIQGIGGTISGNTVENSAAAIQIQPYTQPNTGLVQNNSFEGYVNGIYHNYANLGSGKWTYTNNSNVPVLPPSGENLGSGNGAIKGSNIYGISLPESIDSHTDGFTEDAYDWIGIRVRTHGYSGTGVPPEVEFNTDNNVDGAIALSDSFWADVIGLQFRNTGNSALTKFYDNEISNVDIAVKVFEDTKNNSIVDLDNNEFSNYSTAILVEPDMDIDASTGNVYNGVASGAATLAELFTIEDAIVHEIDEATRGFVSVVPGNTYVTENSFAGIETAPNIQRGIDAASDGWTVNVNDGTYTGNFIVDKRVTLLDANPAPAASIVGTGGTAVTVQSNSVTINGFEISNPDGAHAIYSTGNDTLWIINNIFTHIGDNLLSGPTHAVAIAMNSAEDIHVVGIEDNQFNYIHGGEDPSLTGAAAKSNNGSGTAIGVGWSNAAYSVTDLSIKRNVISNISACTNEWGEGGKGAYGIIINVGGASTGQAYASVTDNEITNLEGLWSHGIGLEGNTPSAVVTNNYIDNLIDYKPEKDAAAVMIEDNTSAATVNISNNSFTNVDAGVRNVTGTQVDITCNWFGSTDPATIAGLTDGPVNVVTYLTDGTDDQPLLTGFQPVSGSCTGVLPVYNATQGIYYPNIQAAVQNANPTGGNDIQVAAGTYVESGQIVIDKDVSITGATAATTIVKTDVSTGSSGDARGWWLVNDGIELNLTNLTLDGSGYLVYQGIRHKGYGSINHVNFTNIKYNESGPTYGGVAVAAFGSGTANVHFDYCNFTEIGRVGVLYFGTGITGSYFTNSTYTGKGDGDWLDYMLDISAGANVVVQYCTVSNNKGVASSDGSTSAGILVSTLYGAGTSASIGYCDIHDNTAGIAAGYDGSDVSVVVANNNDIYNNDYGITTSGDLVSVDATSNWWGDASGPGGTGPGTGDAVDADVDFCPWFDGPVNTTPGLNYLVNNLDTGEGFCTISEAIADADTDAGDVIEVSKGTYYERVVIDKSLTLQGVSEADCIIDGSTQTGNGDGIFIQNGVTDVTIQYLTVQNFAGASGNTDAGIYAIGGNDNLNVNHVTIQDNVGGSGFYANGDIDNVTLDFVTSSGHTIGARGIVIWNGYKSNITITNCHVFNNNCCGIELQDGIASGVTMDNNNVHDNGDSGMSAMGLTSGAGANTMSNNILADNGRFGIEIKNPDGTGLSTGDGSIVLDNNDVSFTTHAGMHIKDHAGIAVFRRAYLTGSGYNDVPTGVVLTNNTVSGYTQTNPGATTSEGFGIVVEGVDHTLSGNTLTNNDVGLQMQGGGHPIPNYNFEANGDGADGDGQSPEYFGRGNAPYMCNIIDGGNTVNSNLIADTRMVVEVGSSVTAPAAITNQFAKRVYNTDSEITYCGLQDANDAVYTLNTHSLDVYPATYAENSTITKSLTIASTAGAATTTLSGDGGSVITIQAEDVDVNGFTITNPNGNYAIKTVGYGGLAVTNNIISDIGNNSTSGNTHAVYVNANGSAISSVIVEDNTFSGIHGGENDPAISNGSASAVYVGDRSANFDVTGLSVQRNIITDVNASIIPWASGNLGGKGAYGVLIGVGASGSGQVPNAIIADNEITDLEGHWAHAIGLEGDTPGASVVNNYIDDLTDYKVELDAAAVMVEDNASAATIAVNNNSFTNVETGIRNATAIQVEGTCNWWGTTDAGTISAMTYGDVLVNPYLDNGTDNSVNIGFQPVPGSCNATYPVFNVTKNVYYPTIQDAVQDANPTGGNDIQVAAGTFFEVGQIVIDKDMTITGDDRTTTILKPDYTATGGYATSSGWIYVEPGVNFGLYDVTLDGRDLSNNQQTIQMAIQSRGELTVERCIVQYIKSSTYDGRGIVTLAGTSNYINDVSMNNIQRIGVHIRGGIEATNPNTTVKNFTYVGKGVGDFLDYGVEFGGGGQGVIGDVLVPGSGANITNCYGVASTDGSVSAGILVTDYYGTFTIAEVYSSEITGNSNGIAVGYAAADISELTAIGNKIYGNDDYGISALENTVVNAADNWWGSADGPLHTSHNSCGGGDEISDNIDFYEWWADEAMTTRYAYPAPTLTCPTAITIERYEERGPYAIGEAAGASACYNPVEITYEDDLAGLKDCNNSGTFTRTWKIIDYLGQELTCTQVITVEDNTAPVVEVPDPITVDSDPGLCSAVVNFESIANDLAHEQGFENASWVKGFDWIDYYSDINRVLSGENGIGSSEGLAHAVITPPAPNFTGAFTRLGGYSDEYGDGFIVSLDVYFDLTDPTVAVDTYGWDLSVAASNQSGGHLQDFIFHTASNVAGEILVAASNNTNFTRRNDLATLNHYAVTMSGWYTMQWDFRDFGDGTLAVDCNLVDEFGTVLWTETRHDASNVIATVVGGNRYMWFTFLETDYLAIDNTLMYNKVVPVSSSPASGYAFPVGTTNVTSTATDACGNVGTNNFDITVEDNEAPVANCKNIDVYLDATGNATILPTAVDDNSTDNCGIDTYAVSQDAFTCADIGTPVTVVLTVTDIHNNSSTCNAVVTVLDDIPPTITCIGNQEVCADTQGTPDTYTISGTEFDWATSDDNCSITDYDWTLSGATTGSGSATLDGIVLNTGITTIEWTATDQSSNTSTPCSFDVTVNPLPDPVVSGAITVYAGETEVYQTTYVAGNTYSWNVTGATSVIVNPSPNDYICEVIWGPAGPGTVEVTETVTATGCSYSDEIAVTINAISLQGTITYKNNSNTSMNNVTVRLKDGATVVASTTTDATGFYKFNAVANNTYTLEVETSKEWGGANSTDALAIQRTAIEPVSPFAWWIPEAFIDNVGDVNQSSNLSSLDALFVKQRTVHLINSFAAGDWAFWDNTNDANFNSPSDNIGTIAYVHGGPATMDIQARCYGDVNGSFLPSSAKNLYAVQKEDVMEVSANKVVNLPVHLVSGDQPIGAMTIHLSYPEFNMDMIELKTEIPGLIYNIENGWISVAWAELEPLDVPNGGVLFTLVLTADKGITDYEELFLLSSETQFADVNAKVLEGVTLSMKEIKLKGGGISSVGNYSIDCFPNPVKDNMNISYTLPENGQVEITILNSLGEQITKLVDDPQEAGSYHLNFIPDQFNLPTGVYYCRMQVQGADNDFNEVVRIVYLK